MFNLPKCLTCLIFTQAVSSCIAATSLTREYQQPATSSIKWEKTQQSIPSTCFSNFQNIYFDNSALTFFTVGKDAKICHSINTSDTRGYSWKENPPIKPHKEPLKVPGTSIFIFERDLTPNHSLHYFHCLEHLLGIWNFGGEIDRLEVKLFVLANNGRSSPKEWKGENAVAYHLIHALFPYAEIKTWDQFLEITDGNILCFEKAITSDRSMEIFRKEPYYTERMLGGYFQLLKKENLDHLASCVWQYCKASRSISHKPMITYVKRASSRVLTSDCEQKLLEKINELSNFEYQIVDFAALSFQEQIQVVANTDILLGVHGNGFSHTLFLPSGATVIELFPENSFRVEYRIIAKARDLNYFGWIDQNGWIDDKTAETLGCHGKIEVQELKTDVNAIIELLQALH